MQYTKTLVYILLILTLIISINSHAANIVIDGNFDDWASIEVNEDPEGDTFGGPEDDTMDILNYKITHDDDFLYVMVAVKDDISEGSTDRGAYQTIIDSDNTYDTGLQSDTESPYPPHEGMGIDRYISVETNQGVYEGVGMDFYDPDAQIVDDDEAMPGAICEAAVTDNAYELKADLVGLGLEEPFKIKVAILHYSEAGTVDWTMPAILYPLEEKAAIAFGKLSTTWGCLKEM